MKKEEGVSSSILPRRDIPVPIISAEEEEGETEKSTAEQGYW